MFGEEMFGFWLMAGFGMFFFLASAGAGINCWLRGKGVLYVAKAQSLSEKVKKE